MVDMMFAFSSVHQGTYDIVISLPWNKWLVMFACETKVWLTIREMANHDIEMIEIHQRKLVYIMENIMA